MPTPSAYPKGGKRKRGQRQSRDIQKDVIEAYGFRKVPFAKGPRPTYTEAHQQFGNCIAYTTKHTVALVDGALRDLFNDSTYEMLKPYCVPCGDDRFLGRRADGSGYDTCSICGSKAAVNLFQDTCERKAMSVWVLNRSRLA